MPVDRKKFCGEILNQLAVSWVCPTCHQGLLQLDKKTYHECEAFESRDWRENCKPDEWEKDADRFVFVALMRCNFESCQEVVSFSGITGKTMDYDQYYMGHGPCMVPGFWPKSIDPAPDLIPIPDRTPDAIGQIIKSAFSLYWLDLASCANKIRIALELLINHILMKRRVPKEQKEKYLTLALGGRIECLGKLNRYKKLYELIMAAKWIGNIGSHESEISRDEVLDAFDFLEMVLQKVFGFNTEKEILKKAKQRNKEEADKRSRKKSPSVSKG